MFILIGLFCFYMIILGLTIFGEAFLSEKSIKTLVKVYSWIVSPIQLMIGLFFLVGNLVFMVLFTIIHLPSLIYKIIVAKDETKC